MKTTDAAPSAQDASIPGTASIATRSLKVAARLFTALIGLILCALIDGSELQAAEPTWSNQITPLARRQDAEIRPVHLLYEVSWSKWLQAGTIRMSFDPQQDAGVQARAKTRSSGPVRAFWPYEGSTRTTISPKTLYPSRFEHAQREHGERAEYRATYRNDRMRVESSLTPTDGRDTEHETRVYELGQIRDILSTLLYLQQTELRDGKDIVLLVQPLDRLYLVTFEVAGSESRTVFERTWKTKKLEIRIRKVTDNFHLAPYTKMRRATIWLSDDAYRVPVEIQADLRIGFVSVRLASLDAPQRR